MVVDERDQGGVQRHALREGFRAVDRVDDPPPPGAAFDVVVLLADDPVTGMRRGKSLSDGASAARSAAVTGEPSPLCSTASVALWNHASVLAPASSASSIATRDRPDRRRGCSWLGFLRRSGAFKNAMVDPVVHLDPALDQPGVDLIVVGRDGRSWMADGVDLDGSLVGDRGDDLLMELLPSTPTFANTMMSASGAPRIKASVPLAGAGGRSGAVRLVGEIVAAGSKPFDCRSRDAPVCGRFPRGRSHRCCCRASRRRVVRSAGTFPNSVWTG